MKNDELLKKVNKLIDSDITSYRIYKDTGVAYGNIDGIRRGERSLDNVTLKQAIKLANFYDKTTGNGED